MTTEAVVVARALTRRYGSVLAASEVSFEVRRGEMFGLIGPDGAGKTTTLRMVLGLLKPDSGEVRTCGLSPQRERRKLSSRVGYLSQRFSLYGDLTVDENVAFFAEIHDVHGYAARRDALLDMVRMTPFRDRLADRLSGGMKQKLALVCTLVHTPELLVLDEPTTGVDPVSRREFWRLLSEFLSQGITILMATPYLDEAERCSRVALMSQGRILALDEPNALRAAFPDDLLEMLADPQDAAVQVVRRDPAVLDVQSFGERLHIRVPRGRGDDAAASITLACGQAGVRVASLRKVPASLEDVFIDRVVTTPGQSAV